MADFSWAAAADVGLGVLGGFAQGRAAQAQAQAANEIREAQNSVARSASMLARTIQTINNRRILEKGGSNLDAGLRTFSRGQDAFARQGFEASVQQAEVLGRAAASAAAAGVGGSSVMAMAGVTAGALARQREYAKSQQEDVTYDQLLSLTNIMPDAVRAMDNSAISPTQNFTKDTAGSTLSYLLGGLMSKKESLHTLLGSLVGDKTKTGGSDAFVGPPDLATSYPVSQSNPIGTPLAPMANTSPVWEYRVQGTPLPPITIK